MKLNLFSFLSHVARSTPSPQPVNQTAPLMPEIGGASTFEAHGAGQVGPSQQARDAWRDLGRTQGREATLNGQPRPFAPVDSDVPIHADLVDEYNRGADEGRKEALERMGREAGALSLTEPQTPPAALPADLSDDERAIYGTARVEGRAGTIGEVARQDGRDFVNDPGRSWPTGPEDLIPEEQAVYAAGRHEGLRAAFQGKAQEIVDNQENFFRESPDSVRPQAMAAWQRIPMSERNAIFEDSMTEALQRQGITDPGAAEHWRSAMRSIVRDGRAAENSQLNPFMMAGEADGRWRNGANALNSSALGYFQFLSQNPNGTDYGHWDSYRPEGAQPRDQLDPVSQVEQFIIAINRSRVHRGDPHSVVRQKAQQGHWGP